jgi:acetyl esterase
MSALEPEVRSLLDTVLLPAKPPFDARRLRLGHLLSQDLLAGETLPVHQVSGFTVDPDPRWGTPRLAVRRYQPRPGCRRAIIWLHGGGWVVGTLDSYDAVARALAVATDSQVFVVDYRLAPEAPYPAALADCSAAVEAIVRDAGNLGLDPARVVVAGDSAGGHLSVGTTRWLAAAGSPARPAALALIYPVTDARMRHHSYARFGEGYFLSAAQMAWFWQQFAPRGASAEGVPLTLEHPDLSPLLAHDLHCLPPTLVVTAECDILHDEGQAFAQVLGRAGVRHEYLEVPRVIHGFLRFRCALRQARDLPRRISEQLDRWEI